jgi:hypothetical protein
MITTNGRHYPTCYSSQREAGLAPGPLEYADEDPRMTRWDFLIFQLSLIVIVGATVIGALRMVG